MKRKLEIGFDLENPASIRVDGTASVELSTSSHSLDAQVQRVRALLTDDASVCIEVPDSIAQVAVVVGRATARHAVEVVTALRIRDTRSPDELAAVRDADDALLADAGA